MVESASIWLPDWLIHCPEYWCNFVNYIKSGPDWHRDVNCEQLINKSLNDRYNAKYIEHDVRIHNKSRIEVRFPTNDALLMFILTWS